MTNELSVQVQQLQRQLQDLTAEHERLVKVFAIGDRLHAEKNLDRLLPLIMQEISAFLDAERSTLFLVDWEKRQLWTKFAEGMDSDQIHIGLKMGLVGSCVLTRNIVNVASAYDSPYFNKAIDERTGYRTESVLCVPMFNREQEIVGALEFLNKNSGTFTKADEGKGQQLASAIGSLDYTLAANRDQARVQISDLRQELACERCALFLLDRQKGEIRSAFAEKIEGWEIRLDLNLGIAGLVAVTGEEITIPDVYLDPRFDRSVDGRTGYTTRCLLCVPLKNLAGEILGVIEVMNKRGGPFSEVDSDHLKSLSAYISMFLENAILFNEQNRQFRSVLEVLAASIDAKDTLTAGHSARVAQYAVGIAHELGFCEEDVDTLNVAALLHDYGKLGTDDRILKKPGKLTREEFEHIKLHVVKTKEILSKMTFSRKYRVVPLLAACHHERLDGSGYSSGLSASEIPFLAKILAVADVFEALTAKRHYREPMPHEQAFAILDQDIGTKFDENVVRALKEYCRKLPVEATA